MRTLGCSLFLLLVGCVTNRFSSRGELYETTEVNKTNKDSPSRVTINGDVAFVTFIKTSCTTVQRQYKHEHNVAKRFPIELAWTLSTLLSGGLAAGAILSDSTSPRIIFGVLSGMIGLMSITGWGTYIASDDRIYKSYEVERISYDDKYDELSEECSDKKHRRTGALNYTVRAGGGIVSGLTPPSGELNLVSARKETLEQGPMTEERFKQLLSSRRLDLEVKLHDAPSISTTVELGCRSRESEPALFQCNMRCAESGGAGRCQTRLQRCLASSDNDEALCRPILDSCLKEKVDDAAAFESCQRDCLRTQVNNLCR